MFEAPHGRGGCGRGQHIHRLGDHAVAQAETILGMEKPWENGGNPCFMHWKCRGNLVEMSWKSSGNPFIYHKPMENVVEM